ncbi:3-methyl-2-oxobutanoate hydroxymethyltransferase [Candidatus Pantoea edessiphila]|uniref:3-methyl-2-oxobutanoate hydroxymethyltransferase n=1 Tax=Candidatus Pantoea edessiphila TaxID=2044610 RepID=A0A2P5T276_9GAMM|nr:3-methyl-2-oxobutanoate hydroxymethyltransferase [Candidatus Pantoea edessiphila]PPI88663.1 3-methyl-2-oxobutanoate hydroxymethyltransferase [Candidatus Pantoea edessiphila]
MKLTTISCLNDLKIKRKKFAVLTAYDFSFAKLFSSEGIEVLLVGDSLGMTLQGHNSTIPVTINDIAYHTSSVRRGAPHALIISDFPFLSYATPQQSFKNAAKLMRAGANMVKLEGGRIWVIETIRMLTERSVSVCGHIGLTPQSINILGKYKVQGFDKKNADIIFENAQAIESAGAQLLILECIPNKLAKIITKTLKIPVIGIGAGNNTDGQILVMYDIFGITDGNIPKFAKNFLSETGDIRAAIRQYISEVKNGNFPSIEHCF